MESEPAICGTDGSANPVSSRPVEHAPRDIQTIKNARLPGKDISETYDVSLKNGRFHQSTRSRASILSPALDADSIIDANGALLAPSLCNPHMHLDKAFLLSHPRHAAHQLSENTFAEAIALTSRAKANFSPEDLHERGTRVLEESLAAGVTHMRGFFEVDGRVGKKCVEAAVRLQKEWAGRCELQVCCFAQDPAFSGGNGEGDVVRALMEEVASWSEVQVVGTTPYVESDRVLAERNVEWAVELSARENVHLDFHLDYGLDVEVEAMVWFVVETLKAKRWKERTTGKTVVLGHCTRLTLFSPKEWTRLRGEIGDLPISFVGLPNSDLFMMRSAERRRGTIDVLQMIKEHDLSACLGINNIGNAFTPQGSCDPLTVACNGIATYQAGTQKDAEILYECISTRARRAIGVPAHMTHDDWQSSSFNLTFEPDDDADYVLFGAEQPAWRTRKTVSEAVYLYDHCRGRRTFRQGRLMPI